MMAASVISLETTFAATKCKKASHYKGFYAKIIQDTMTMDIFIDFQVLSVGEIVVLILMECEPLLVLSHSMKQSVKSFEMDHWIKIGLLLSMEVLVQKIIIDYHSMKGME